MLKFSLINNYILIITVIIRAYTASFVLNSRYYLPETRGKDPNEIALLCKYGLSSKPLQSPTSVLDTITANPVTDIKTDR